MSNFYDLNITGEQIQQLINSIPKKADKNKILDYINDEAVSNIEIWMEKTAIDFSEGDASLPVGTDKTISYGETFEVMIDEKIYNVKSDAACIDIYGDGNQVYTAFIGNGMYVGLEDNGLPFIVISSDILGQPMMGVTEDLRQVHTVSITKIIDNKKIDNKLINASWIAKKESVNIIPEQTVLNSKDVYLPGTDNIDDYFLEVNEEAVKLIFTIPIDTSDNILYNNVIVTCDGKKYMTMLLIDKSSHGYKVIYGGNTSIESPSGAGDNFLPFLFEGTQIDDVWHTIVKFKDGNEHTIKVDSLEYNNRLPEEYLPESVATKDDIIDIKDDIADIVVDQTFDGTSENAQSGKAIIQKMADIANGCMKHFGVMNDNNSEYYDHILIHSSTTGIDATTSIGAIGVSEIKITQLSTLIEDVESLTQRIADLENQIQNMS